MHTDPGNERGHDVRDGVLLSVATRRHVEQPPPHPLEPALDPRPGLEARGIEAVGWRQLEGEANGPGNGNRLLADVNGGGPRHEKARKSGSDETQCMGPSKTRRANV